MLFRVPRLFATILLAFAFAFATLLTTKAPAQQPKVFAPHKPVPIVLKNFKPPREGTLRSMIGGLWMVNANFKSSLYFRNGINTSPFVVTPILYLSNGTKYILPKVALEPSGVAVLSVNDALQNQGIAPYATLSGYVEVQYTSFYDPICVVVNNVDTEHSLIFTSVLRPLSHLTHPPEADQHPAHTFEGMWWKEEPSVSGFVAISNITSQPVQATIQISDAESKPLGEHMTTVSPHGTKLVNLSELQSGAGTNGGVRIAYSGAEDSLIVNGHLQDQSTGYSAAMPFRTAPSTGEKSSSISFSQLGLMTGAADPMMSFPAGSEFTPFSIVRNISGEPISVRPNLWWMQSGQAKSAQLSWITLNPYQTIDLNFTSLLAKSGLGQFNGSVNLVLDLKGRPHSLLMAGGSVDRSKNYVFQVLPRAVEESTSKEISYWSTANGNDTMVTLWNPADEAQDFVFTLFFSGGQYDLPLHLEPRVTRAFNISEIAQNQVPDRNGNVVPASIHEGSARIAGTQDERQHILVAIEAGTYNVRKATCSYYCIYCDGYIDAFIGIAPFPLAKGGTYQLDVYAYWDTTNNETLTSLGTGSTWSSSNTGIATVSVGKVKGVAVGNVTVTGTADNENEYWQDCAYDPQCYSQSGNMGGTGTGSVFEVTNVLPTNLVLGQSGIFTIYGQGFQSLGSPTAQFSTGSGITTGAPSVTSDSQMTVSYQVTCSALVGGQTLQIGSSIDGGIFGTTWPENVVLPSAPAPTIKFGGNAISGTQSVVVGQQIALSSSVSLPACMSISSQQWAPSQSTTAGTPVGGYSASTSSGSVTALPANTNSSYTFYWVYPTSGATATYQYTMSGGGSSVASPVSTATFNVTGAGSMTPYPYTKVTIDSLQPCGGGTAGPAMVYGNITGTICKANAGGTWGIYFVPTGAPAGTYSYVQLINTDTTTYTPNSGSLYTCTTSQGVDSSFPYAGIIPATNPPQSLDAPGVPLPSVNYNTVNRSFNATMFLLFTSSVSGSITVPLGYQTWAFNGTAKCTSSCGTVSKWTPTTNGTPGPIGSFTTSNGTQSTNGYTSLTYGYPTWGDVATRSCN